MWPAVAADNSGGCYVGFLYYGTSDGTAVQHLNSNGDLLWPANIEQFPYTFTPNVQAPKLAQDTAGGVFALTGRGTLHRLDFSGAVVAGWPGSGVQITAAGAIFDMQPDATGGVLISWNSRIQRINADSTVAAGWPSGGVVLSTSSTAIYSRPRFIVNSPGSAIVALNESSNSQTDIRAQSVTSSGQIAPGWPAEALPVCVAAGGQGEVRIASDTVGGAFICWQDSRSADADIYIQHITSGGLISSGWPVNGLSVTPAGSNQAIPEITSDGSGGAVLAWVDSRNGASDIYGTHITATGQLATGWIAGGNPICIATGVQNQPRIERDINGNYCFLWADGRLGSTYGLYGVKMSPAGGLLSGWQANGTHLGSNADGLISVSQGQTGSIFVAWDDNGSAGSNIFATRISPPASANLWDLYN